MEPTGEEQPIRHESGLEFLPPIATAAPGRGGSSRLFGQLLNEPQFSDLASFRAETHNMDIVDRRAVFLGGKNTVVGNEIEGFKAIVSARSDKVYSVMSDRYQVMQDREITLPLLEAMTDTGIKPVGRIDGAGTGLTRGHVILTNPEFKVRLLQNYDDNVMLGVRFWNSYTGQSSFGAEMFGVRMVCVNYNLWGSILGRFSQKHMAFNNDQAMQAYADLITSSLDKVPTLKDLVEKAAATVIVGVEVPDLLWGLGLPLKEIDGIAADPTYYAPEIAKQGYTAWTLYNAATAAITWRKGSGKSIDSTESYARKVVDLLDEQNHDKLIERGRARAKAYEENLKRLAKKRAEAKVEVLARQVA